MVLEGTTIRQRRLALKTLPASLAEAFARMVDRIQKLPLTQAKLGMQVLLWLHMAYRPFKLEELRHALAVEPGDTELDPDNIPSSEIMLSCCLGLAIVDEETLTVRFVHYSLEEFFNDENASKYFPDRFTSAAEICLTYLNFGRVFPSCKTLEEYNQRKEEFGFLEYAACHWGHYVRLQSHDPDGVMELVLRLLLAAMNSVTFITNSAFQALYHYIYPYYEDQSNFGFCRLLGTHVTAYFGLHRCISRLTAQGWNKKDGHHRTPLSHAARGGHEAIVWLLLQQGGVEVNSKDDVGRTPLLYAAEKGHEAVVRLLLEQEGVEVNSRNQYHHRTPLSYAAEGGHEAVVRLLLGQEGVDVNAKNRYNRTPLSYAAKGGHEAAVRLLLEQEGVEVDSNDDSSSTPLSYAAWGGQEAIVRLLLEQEGVEVNSKDDEGRTPLSYAAEWGHEAIVRLLLEQEGVEVNSNDNSGRTPLSRAAEEGDEAIVRLLLEQEGVEVNSKDDEGRTPLSYAAEGGHEAVALLLREYGAHRYESESPTYNVAFSWPFDGDSD